MLAEEVLCDLMGVNFVLAFLFHETVIVEPLGISFTESLDGLGYALIRMTIALLRHAEVVEHRMRRLVCRKAFERDMFEGERLFTGSDEEDSDRLPIGVFKDLTETPLGFDGMSHA